MDESESMDHEFGITRADIDSYRAVIEAEDEANPTYEIHNGKEERVKKPTLSDKVILAILEHQKSAGDRDILSGALKFEDMATAEKTKHDELSFNPADYAQLDDGSAYGYSCKIMHNALHRLGYILPDLGDFIPISKNAAFMTTLPHALLAKTAEEMQEFVKNPQKVTTKLKQDLASLLPTQTLTSGDRVFNPIVLYYDAKWTRSKPDTSFYLQRDVMDEELQKIQAELALLLPLGDEASKAKRKHLGELESSLVEMIGQQPAMAADEHQDYTANIMDFEDIVMGCKGADAFTSTGRFRQSGKGNISVGMAKIWCALGYDFVASKASRPAEEVSIIASFRSAAGYETGRKYEFLSPQDVCKVAWALDAGLSNDDSTNLREAILEFAFECGSRWCYLKGDTITHAHADHEHLDETPVAEAAHLESVLIDACMQKFESDEGRRILSRLSQGNEMGYFLYSLGSDEDHLPKPAEGLSWDRNLVTHFTFGTGETLGMIDAATTPETTELLERINDEGTHIEGLKGWLFAVMYKYENFVENASTEFELDGKPFSSFFNGGRQYNIARAQIDGKNRDEDTATAIAIVKKLESALKPYNSETPPADLGMTALLQKDRDAQRARQEETAEIDAYILTVGKELQLFLDVAKYAVRRLQRPDLKAIDPSLGFVEPDPSRPQPQNVQGLVKRLDEGNGGQPKAGSAAMEAEDRSEAGSAAMEAEDRRSAGLAEPESDDDGPSEDGAALDNGYLEAVPAEMETIAKGESESGDDDAISHDGRSEAGLSAMSSEDESELPASESESESRDDGRSEDGASSDDAFLEGASTATGSAKNNFAHGGGYDDPTQSGLAATLPRRQRQPRRSRRSNSRSRSRSPVVVTDDSGSSNPSDEEVVLPKVYLGRPPGGSGLTGGSRVIVTGEGGWLSGRAGTVLAPGPHGHKRVQLDGWPLPVLIAKNFLRSTDYKLRTTTYSPYTDANKVLYLVGKTVVSTEFQGHRLVTRIPGHIVLRDTNGEIQHISNLNALTLVAPVNAKPDEQKAFSTNVPDEQEAFSTNVPGGHGEHPEYKIGRELTRTTGGSVYQVCIHFDPKRDLYESRSGTRQIPRRPILFARTEAVKGAIPLDEGGIEIVQFNRAGGPV